MFFPQHFCSADPCTQNKISHAAVNYSEHLSLPLMSLYKTDYKQHHTNLLSHGHRSPFAYTRNSTPPLGAHIASCLMGYRGSSPPQVKRPVRRTNHSPPSSADIKSEWSYTSDNPHTFMACNTDDFTLLFVTSTKLHPRAVFESRSPHYS